MHHVTYVTVEDDDDDEWVTFAYVAAYTGSDGRLGLRGVGQRLVLPALCVLRRVLPSVLPVSPHLRHGRVVQPAHGRVRAWCGCVRAVRRCGHGRVVQPAHGNLRARRSRVRPVWITVIRGRRTTRARARTAQTRQGSNVYGNWGSTSVQRGDDWAQSAHVQNYRHGTTTTGVRNDDGAGAVTRTGPGGRRTTVARTEGGDVYAGRDGNVYRRNDGGGWEQSNGSGGWNPAEDGREEPRLAIAPRRRAERSSG